MNKASTAVNLLRRVAIGSALLGLTSLGLAADRPQPKTAASVAAQRERTRAGQQANNNSNSNAPTEQELSGMADFMKQNAPERFKVFLNGREGPAKQQFRQFLVNRWRRLEDLKKQSPELYQVRVNEIQLDDQIFTICRQLRRATPTERESLQKQLNEKVTALFDNGISERKIRIAQLQERLKKQTQQLESDTRNRDTIIARQSHQIETQGVAGARLKNPGRAVDEAAPKPHEEDETPDVE